VCLRVSQLEKLATGGTRMSKPAAGETVGFGSPKRPIDVCLAVSETAREMEDAGQATGQTVVSAQLLQGPAACVSLCGGV